MKSKRFLTVLLSLAIMLTFMPATTFALSPGLPSEGHDFTINADESNVVYSVAPTCTKSGIGVVTCTKSHGGVQCKATANEEVPAYGHDLDKKKVVTAEEFAAMKVKEDPNVTEEDAKNWLAADGREICTGEVYPCKRCGFYYKADGSEYDFVDFYNDSVSRAHVAPDGLPECAATFDCVVCGQKDVSNLKYNAANRDAYHGIDSNGNWTWSNYNSTFGGHFIVKTQEYKAHETTVMGSPAQVYVKVLACKECGLERMRHRVGGAAYDIKNFDHTNTVTETKEPTCTAPGWTATVCADCGYEIKKDGKPALNHDYQKATVYPATESHGEMVCGVCTRCQAKDYNWETVSPILEHNITSTVIAPKSCLDCTWILVECTNPSCTEGTARVKLIDEKADVQKLGSKFYFNFDGKQVPVPFEEATGHTWGDKQTIHEATCTEGAEEGRTCTVCGAINHNSVREISKALGHDVEEVVVAPTCGEAGYSYKICNRCTNYLKQDGKTVLGKTTADFEAAKYAPTNPVVKLGAKCQYEWQTLEEATPFKLGTRAKICTVCGHELAATKESIAKTKIAAPKVKALKKKAKVTVKAVPGAVKYQILVNGKVSKTVKKAGTYTVKKKIKKGKKNTFKIRAINAEGVKATSAAKSVKIKK